MKKIFFLVLILCFSQFAFAQFYVGANIDVTYWDTKETHDVSGAHDGFGFSSGYKLTSYLAIDAFYKFNKWRTPQYNFEGIEAKRGTKYYRDHFYGLGLRGNYKWFSATAGLAQHHMNIDTVYLYQSRLNGSTGYTTTLPYFGIGFIIDKYKKLEPYGDVIKYYAKEVELLDFALGMRYKF